jgi:hypothetical protein
MRTLIRALSPLLVIAATASMVAGCSTDETAVATDGADGNDGTTTADGSDGTTSPDGTDGNDSPDGTDGATGLDVKQPGPVCTPDEVKGCTANFQSAVVCNEDGDGYETRACKDDRDEASRCDETLGCLPCSPLKVRCRDDEVAEICAEDGSEFITYKDCFAEGTAQVCNGGACIEECELSKKQNSYQGCDFWACDLDNAFVPGGRSGYYDAAGAQYSIVVSNPNTKRSATVEITDSDGKVNFDSKQLPIDYSPIPPGGLRVFNVPRRDVDGTTLAPLAYRVEASIPVSVYQFNPLENVGVFSNDASIILPENVLDEWYIVMTREQTFEILRGQLAVIGTSETPTDVTVTVTAHTLENKALGIPALSPGDSYKATLHKYDILSIETNRPGDDLTGSVVLATNRVAVFGASEASNAPNTARCKIAPGEESGFCEWDGATECESPLDCLSFNTCCADHLEMQMFPVRTWGKRYIAARSYPRGKAKDVWRILAAEDGTVVTTVPPQANIPVLNSGEHFEFESSMDFEVISKKPVLVGQFLAAQDAPDPNVGGNAQADDAKIGDPAFMLAVPYEQYRVDYVFIAPPKYAFNYITITAPTGSEIILDGEVIDSSRWTPIGTGEFSSAFAELKEGTHDIRGDEPFGIISYGWDDYVSYGYPGGLDLRDLKFIKPPGEK